VIDLQLLCDRHGAKSGEVMDGAVGRHIFLRVCLKNYDGFDTFHRMIPIASDAVVDESNYIAKRVAERLMT
jgi:hypothetical protein